MGVHIFGGGSEGGSGGCGCNTALGSGNYDPASSTQWNEVMEDFVGYPSTWGSPLGVQINNSGASNIATCVLTCCQATTAGIIAMGTGTACTHYTYARGFSFAWADNWAFCISYRVKLGTAIPTVCDDYYAAFGMWSVNVLDTTPSDGFFFRIDRSIDACNWIASTANANTTCNSDTCVAFNTGFKIFRISTNGTTATYFIDGVQVAQHTTNFPIADDVRFHIYHTNVAGATTRYIHYDWWKFAYRSLANRGTS